MHKQKARALACGLLSVVLAFSFAGCKKDNTAELEKQIAELESENASLRTQIDALTAQLAEDVGLYLSEWNMLPTVWDGSGGADVQLTAVPSSYRDGMEAEFLVYLDGQKVASAKCVWNGTSFNATVPIRAADGYSFFCSLSDSTGENAQILLSSPDAPTEDTLVYLQSSLTAYCNLFLGDWTSQDGRLTVQNSYAQVQLPRLAESGTSVGFRGARLVLKLNGQEIDSQNLTMPEGEGPGSYEENLSDLSFTVPQLGNDDQLDLVLEVTLTTDAVISTVGGSWFLADGQLNLVVG